MNGVSLMDSVSVRLGVIGCGAVFRNCHLPAFRELVDVTISAVVDDDAERAALAAAAVAEVRGSQPLVGTSVAQVLTEIDAAVVCTSNATHAAIARQLLGARKHVLVEKPLATTVADCEELAALAAETGLVVAAGHVRRLFPVGPWVANVVASGMLGTVRRIDWQEGDVFAWPVMSDAIFRPDLAAGGVVMDVGVHVFDMLMMWFGTDAEVVEYSDDATGGVESEASIRLRIAGATADVVLSRQRKLSNSCVITGSRASLAVGIGFDADYEIRSSSGYVTGSGSVPAMPQAAQAWSDLYTGQMRSFLSAIGAGTKPLADAEAGGCAVELAIACYNSGKRGQLARPWTTRAVPRVRLAGRRVAVTGATGFLGSRLAELLSTETAASVVAMAHSYSRLARLAALNQERLSFAAGDVTNVSDLASALAGADIVVHCAYGNAGSVDERWRTSVEGTQAVVKASMEAGVRRLVHVSSISVYEPSGRKTITEQSPYLKADPGDREYDQQKLEAERIVAEVAAAGLEVVIIQPGFIYGPYGPWWTADPLRRLAVNPALLPSGSGSGICNAVYVDDVAAAILLAAELPGLAQERFIVTGQAPVSWGEFYDAYRDMLGLPHTAQDVEFLPAWERALYLREITASSEHASAVLGYSPQFGLADGMTRVRHWARWQGLLPVSSPRRADGTKRSEGTSDH